MKNGKKFVHVLIYNYHSFENKFENKLFQNKERIKVLNQGKKIIKVCNEGKERIKVIFVGKKRIILAMKGK